MTWAHRKKLEEMARQIDPEAWVMPDTADKINRRLAARDEASRRMKIAEWKAADTAAE